MSIYSYTLEADMPKYLGGKKWTLNNLNYITVIFGKNGSGKSILLRKLRDVDVNNIHYIVPERIGTIAFESGYMNQELNPEQRKNYSNNNFYANYRQSIIARIQGYFISRGATRTNNLESNPKDLEELLSTVFPDFDILLQGKNPPYILKRLSDGTNILDVNNLSSGEAQVFTLALDILTISAIWDIENQSKRIILIDEPDAHLHPDLQVRLADFLIKVVNKYKVQILISTHSTTMLSALGVFGGEKTSIIYLLKSQLTFNAKKFDIYLKELSTCLGGHILMGPLFGAPLLLVEGDDDYRVWSQIPRHGTINLAVIPSNGDEIKKYQYTLEKIFSSISEEKILGHALLDGDKNVPQPNQNNMQKYIKFIKLSCRECENLYLTNEVLSDINITWDEAKNKILQECSKFGNKSEELKQITRVDRQSADLKNIINEISNILDSKHVHWTTRVGNRLGKDKPTGELANFLGESVISAIWHD